MGKKHVKRDISCMLLQTVKCKGTIKKVQTKPKNKNKKIKITLCQPQLNFKKKTYAMVERKRSCSYFDQTQSA